MPSYQTSDLKKIVRHYGEFIMKDEKTLSHDSGFCEIELRGGNSLFMTMHPFKKGYGFRFYNLEEAVHRVLREVRAKFRGDPSWSIRGSFGGGHHEYVHSLEGSPFEIIEKFGFDSCGCYYFLQEYDKYDENFPNLSRMTLKEAKKAVKQFWEKQKNCSSSSLQGPLAR